MSPSKASSMLPTVAAGGPKEVRSASGPKVARWRTMSRPMCPKQCTVATRMGYRYRRPGRSPPPLTERAFRRAVPAAARQAGIDSVLRFEAVLHPAGDVYAHRPCVRATEAPSGFTRSVFFVIGNRNKKTPYLAARGSESTWSTPMHQNAHGLRRATQAPKCRSGPVPPTAKPGSRPSASR